MDDLEEEKGGGNSGLEIHVLKQTGEQCQHDSSCRSPASHSNADGIARELWWGWLSAVARWNRNRIRHVSGWSWYQSLRDNRRNPNGGGRGGCASTLSFNRDDYDGSRLELAKLTARFARRDWGRGRCWNNLAGSRNLAGSWNYTGSRNRAGRSWLGGAAAHGLVLRSAVLRRVVLGRESAFLEASREIESLPKPKAAGQHRLFRHTPPMYHFEPHSALESPPEQDLAAPTADALRYLVIVSLVKGAMTAVLAMKRAR